MTLLRILVILLLLANIAWLAWTQWRVEPEPVTPATPAAIPPPADVPALELLSERPDPMPACFAVGPFRDRSEAQRVQARLSEYAARHQLRSTEATEDRGWWVYLPAPENRSVAAQNMRDLRQAGFAEAYLINTGEFRNAVSLGLFSSEANAQSLFEEVSAAGFDPVMGGRTETVDHFWVDYEPSDGIDAPWQIITRRDPLVGRHDITCFADRPEPPDEDAEPAQTGLQDSPAAEESEQPTTTSPAELDPNSEASSAESEQQPESPEPAPAESSDQPTNSSEPADNTPGSP